MTIEKTLCAAEKMGGSMDPGEYMHLFLRNIGAAL